MALVFIIAGLLGVAATVVALNSTAYRNLSRRYAKSKAEVPGEVTRG